MSIYTPTRRAVRGGARRVPGIRHKTRLMMPLLFLMLGFAAWPGNALAGRFPKTRGYVSDFAGILDAGTQSSISAVAREVEQKTSAQIAVVTLKSTGGDTIEQTAVDLFKEWGIGKKGKDNGVLLIASMEERKVRIETGYGLEGILPDGKCGEIIDRYILPEFRAGAYGKGLTVGTYALGYFIAEDAGVKLAGIPVTERAQEKRAEVPLVFKLLGLAVMGYLFVRHPFLFVLLLGAGRGGGGGGGFGGGFGGFGGGGSGGGGASRGW